MGQTALHAAAQAGSGECIRNLAAGGADMEARTMVRGTHPHAQHAASCVKSIVPEFLSLIPCKEIPCIAPLAFPQAVDRHRTPLDLAISFKQLEAVRALVTAGAGLRAFEETGRTPLHLAAEYAGGAPEIALELLSAGADRDAKCKARARAQRQTGHRTAPRTQSTGISPHVACTSPIYHAEVITSA